MVNCTLLQRVIKGGLHDEQKSEESCTDTWSTDTTGAEGKERKILR